MGVTGPAIMSRKTTTRTHVWGVSLADYTNPFVGRLFSALYQAFYLYDIHKVNSLQKCIMFYVVLRQVVG
jgi:hypothetical protein